MGVSESRSDKLKRRLLIGLVALILVSNALNITFHVIHFAHQSVAYQRFYLLIISLILCEACVLPFQFVFIEHGGETDAPNYMRVFHSLVTAFYIADVYLSFHLTYVDKKSEVVYDLHLISRHYTRSGR